MRIYRLSKGKFRNDLSGKGAELAGGRWNNKGVAMVYTAASRSLCAMEVLVHMPIGLLPSDYYMTTIELPDTASLLVLEQEQLPANWNSIPHGNDTQLLGDRFIREQQSLLLKVPSAVVNGEFNYLLNPAHPEFHQVKVVEALPFEFDSRLFKV